MHRTQILLEQKQYQLLHAEARRKGISLSALIRHLVDERFAGAREPAPDPLKAITGIGSGSGEPAGREHNRYLYGTSP